MHAIIQSACIHGSISWTAHVTDILYRQRLSKSKAVGVSSAHTPHAPSDRGFHAAGHLKQQSAACQTAVASIAAKVGALDDQS